MVDFLTTMRQRWFRRYARHQQNLNQSSTITPSSQTLRVTSPVLLSTSRCSQTPLELSKVISYSERAFSGAPESTSNYGGAFRMLWEFANRIVEFFSSWDLRADLWETSREAKTTAPLGRRLGAVIWQQWFLHYHKAFCLCYSHKICYSIIRHALFKSFYIYTYGQSGRKWESSIVGGASGHTHWESLEMYHLEAIGVKQWSKRAESPASTLRHTPRNI